MHIGFLKTDTLRADFAEKYGEYPDMFARCFSLIAEETQSEIKYSTYDVQLGEYPEHIDEVDCYLITGSKISVYDDAPWIAVLMDFVKQLHAQKKPIIGVCFGHQLIAQALGGKTAKAENGWQVGVIETKLLPAAANFGIELGTFNFLYSHQDQVVKPAEGAEVLASTQQCPIATTRLGKHIFTMQGHPEFSAAYAADLFESRREILGEDLTDSAIASLKKPVYSLATLRWALDFVFNQRD